VNPIRGIIIAIVISLPLWWLIIEGVRWIVAR
jgi:hypothetical protein